MGFALHLAGNVTDALQHLERCVAYSAGASSSTGSKLGFDLHLGRCVPLARCLWLRGSYSRARAVALEAIAKAHDSGTQFLIALR